VRQLDAAFGYFGLASLSGLDPPLRQERREAPTKRPWNKAEMLADSQRKSKIRDSRSGQAETHLFNKNKATKLLKTRSSVP
jgi:hypothetical protein